MKHLYLVRHGQTLFNRKLLIQGCCDSPLTEEGRSQAARVGRFLAHEGVAFDHAYASTLARTHQTIEAIVDGLPQDLAYAREAGLCEWFFGEYEGERICGTLRDIMVRPEHESVLAVSHGSASREFLLEWRRETALGYPDVPGNCSVMCYDFDGDRFDLVRVVEQDEMREVLGE